MLTDQACVFPLLAHNRTGVVEACGLSPDLVLIEEYNWGESTSHLSPPLDVVLVSDCILPKLYPIEPLVQVGIANFVLLCFIL